MMMGTTVNSAALNINPAINTVASNKRVTETTQDFSEVLNSATQKTEKSYENTQTEQFDEKDTYNVETKETESVEETNDTQKAEDVSNKKVNTEEKDDTDVVSDENISDVQDEPVDEMTIEEIADALQQIIEQIKEILGVSDEQILSGMEQTGMNPVDLLDSANMAQLVTAISGEDSVISLVADEDLYTAMQDITKAVDAQVSTLLEETGLTQEELDVVLEKLNNIETNTMTDVQKMFESIIKSESQNEVMDETSKIAATSENAMVDNTDEIVVIKEDNTQTQNVTKFPENSQQSNLENEVKTQSHDNDGKDAENGQPKDFNQNLNQNLQNNTVDTVNANIEKVDSFISEKTQDILRQIADMVRIAKGENLTEMEMQLHPASLGTVNVTLTTKGGLVTAEFTTQNEAVKAAVEAQVVQLRTNLEEQGVKIEAIEVSVESHQMERNLDKNNQGQNGQTQEEQNGRIQGIRRKSINLKAFENGEELIDEMQGADDATRIAMEIMAANGNSMDLLA